MSNAIRTLCAIMMIATAAKAAMAQDANDYRVTEIALIDIDTDGDPFDEAFRPDPDIHGTIGLNNLNQIVYTRKINGVFTAFLWLPSPDYGLSAGLHDLEVPTELAGDFIARDISFSLRPAALRFGLIFD